MYATLTTGIVLISLIYGLIRVTEILTLHNQRKRIISQGHFDKAEILENLKKNQSNSYPSLKWGLVAFFGALGLIISEFIPYHFETSPLPFGLIVLGVALGFLIYFFLVRKMDK
ncbi:MAG TPA: hypothetical protein ENF21_00535 [Bacteroidetes bacterium]|nr:hypothetical protein [Bacteroidota bacterium]